MVTTAASSQAQHSGRERSATLRLTYIKNTANSWAVGHPSTRKLRQEDQLQAIFSCTASSKPAGAVKSCQKQVRMPPSSQHFKAGFQPFLQSPGSQLGGSCSGTLASLEVWQIPYTPHAGANMDAVLWALPKKIFSPSVEAPINVV